MLPAAHHRSNLQVPWWGGTGDVRSGEETSLLTLPTESKGHGKKYGRKSGKKEYMLQRSGTGWDHWTGALDTVEEAGGRLVWCWFLIMPKIKEHLLASSSTPANGVEQDGTIRRTEVFLYAMSRYYRWGNNNFQILTGKGAKKKKQPRTVRSTGGKWGIEGMPSGQRAAQLSDYNMDLQYLSPTWSTACIHIHMYVCIHVYAIIKR